MSNEMLRELETVRQILASAAPVDRQEWHNACKAYDDELEKLQRQMTPEMREAIIYIKDREVSFVLRDLIDHLQAQSESLATRLSQNGLPDRATG